MNTLYLPNGIGHFKNVYNVYASMHAHPEFFSKITDKSFNLNALHANLFGSSVAPGISIFISH